MTNTPLTSSAEADGPYKALFDALPGNSVLLANDAPRYTIIAATPQYLKDTNSRKEDLIGRGIFEAFPPNTADPNSTGEKDMHASYYHVLLYKEPHYLPVQRYDLKKEDGSFSEKYWKASNKPVFTADGEVGYIIHTAEDITDQIKSQQQEEKLKGIEKAYNLFMHVPAIIAIFKGEENVIEMANEATLKLTGKGAEIIGKPLLQALPKAKGWGLDELLHKVRRTGKPYLASEVPAYNLGAGTKEARYFDVIYQPYYDGDVNNATGVFTMSHEVTELVMAKRKVEEAKKEVERQKRVYETINSSTPDLIYVFDLNYKFTYANKALLNMWGSSWERSVGKGLLENGYEPWHAEMHEREIDQVVTTKKSIRGEVSFPHAALGRRAYDYIFSPVINEKGEVEAVAGSTRDITEMRRAEQTIRESEERFRKLADDSPIFVFIIEPGASALVNYWNKTWLEYTGQSLEEAIERAWDGIIHPDDVPVVMDYYVPAYENRSSYLIPAVRVKRHDGEYRWHTFKGNPRYLPNGDFNGYVGVGFDIHEQKLSEEMIKQSEAQLQIKVAERTSELENQKNLFDNILKNSSNGISVTEVVRDEKGNIIDANTILANDAAVKYVGLPREVFLSKTAVEIDPNILNSSYGQSCLKTLATGEPALSQYYMEPTGRWLELTLSKMDDDHLIHIFTDVTPIKESQLQLERTINELKRSNANLEEFAYAASHDLKEPIRKIRTFSDRLKKNFQGRLLNEDEHYFQRMDNATERMQKLIDDLLEYSHVSMASDDLDEIDLNKKVTQVLEDLEVEVAEKNAKVIVGSLPKIKGHRRQMLQLFQNLITNALKFTRPDCCPEIRISSAVIRGEDINYLNLPEDAKNKRYNLIEISDNGIGFKQEYADKIFKMFQRLHGKTEYAGTGIGLTIVRKVVENHKGFIKAEGETDKGATFKVYLPIG